MLTTLPEIRRRSQRLDDDVVASLLTEYQSSGDLTLRNRVVEAHIALARHICGDYRDRGVEYDDLVQVATVGLIKAAERFDPSMGVPYRAFASRTVNGEIKRWFRDRGWSIRPPRSLIELGTSIKKTRARLSQELQRSPTAQELATELGVDVDDVLAAIEAGSAYRSDSLTRPNDDGDDTTVAVPQDDDGLRRAEMQTAVEALLDTLGPEDREIVRLRFWEERSQQEIADIIGVSQMQVSRILRKTLRNLRTVGEFDE